MKIEKVIQVTTDSIEEEQFLLTKCPEAVWWPKLVSPGKPPTTLTFEFSENKEEKVKEVVNEWKKLNE